MDLFHIACGTKANPKWLTLARCNRDPIARQVRQAADEGARKVDDLEEKGIFVFDRKAEQDLCCIHLLRLSGYIVVLQPIIPDFGYDYTINMNTWSVRPSVRQASFGTLALLNEIRIFRTGGAAKRYHEKKLEAKMSMSEKIQMSSSRQNVDVRKNSNVSSRFASTPALRHDLYIVFR